MEKDILNEHDTFLTTSSSSTAAEERSLSGDEESSGMFLNFNVTLDGVDVANLGGVDEDVIRFIIAPINFFMLMVSAIGLAYLYRYIHNIFIGKVDNTRSRLRNIILKHSAKVIIFFLFELIDVGLSSSSWCIWKGLYWPSKVVQQIPGVSFHLGVVGSISITLYFIWRCTSLKIVDTSCVFVLLSSTSIFLQHNIRARLITAVEEDRIETSPFLEWYKKQWFPMIAWFVAEFISLLFTMHVAKVFDKGNFKESLFARNIYQDMNQKPFIRILATFITQHSLFIFYKGTLDIFTGHAIEERLEEKYYVVAVCAIMAYVLRHDPISAIIESTKFWGTLFHQRRQEGNVSVVENFELFLRFFADVYCNVFTATSILLIIPYQASVAARETEKDEGAQIGGMKTSALDFVLNLIAIIYIIELDDLPATADTDGVFQLNKSVDANENDVLLESKLEIIQNLNYIEDSKTNGLRRFTSEGITDDEENFKDEIGLSSSVHEA